MKPVGHVATQVPMYRLYPEMQDWHTEALAQVEHGWMQALQVWLLVMG